MIGFANAGGSGTPYTFSQNLPTITVNLYAGSGDSTTALLNNAIVIPLKNYKKIHLSSGSVTVYKKGTPTVLSTVGDYDISGSDYMTISIYYSVKEHPTVFTFSFPSYTLS